MAVESDVTIVSALFAAKLGRPSHSPAKITGEGLIARFSPLKGITPRAALDRDLWLPAVLNTFTIDEQALHNEYDTLSGGKFSQPAMGDQNARQLRTTSLDSLILDFDAPYLVATGQDPFELRKRIYNILHFRKPVRLVLTFNPPRHQPYAELDMYCTLRGVSKELRPNENEARYLTITISEWRNQQVGRRSSTPNGSSRKKGVVLPTTHKLKSTDTLWSLSNEFYGSYSFWRHIRDANGISKKFGMKTPLVKLPGRWKVGYKIKIPKITVRVTAP